MMELSKCKTVDDIMTHMRETPTNRLSLFGRMPDALTRAFQLGQPQWLQIDDKAKDGTVVWVSNGFSIRLAFWKDGEQYEHQGSHGGGWRDFGASENMGRTDLQWLPTHWQPLPAPPAEGGE